jgi:hypothetical protein
MSEILLHPGQPILYMKIGVHAREPLDSIVARKLKEIEDEGYAMWGYGGSTCHPSSMVQPFASSSAERGQTIYLCMREMNSKHWAEQIRASEYSVDGEAWRTIPRKISVLGSRYALTIKNLRKEEFALPLEQTRVALGNSAGATGAKYVAGRVDKACLVLAAPTPSPSETARPAEPIGLVAELCEPYAVFLRNS